MQEQNRQDRDIARKIAESQMQQLRAQSESVYGGLAGGQAMQMPTIEEQLHSLRESLTDQLAKVDRLLALIESNPDILDGMKIAREIHIR